MTKSTKSVKNIQTSVKDLTQFERSDENSNSNSKNDSEKNVNSNNDKINIKINTNDINVIKQFYKDSLENKFIAAFLLHAVGDTIGFKNGEWEFNYHAAATLNTTTEILFDFIDLGGINSIDLSGWNVSDDTILNIAVAKGIIKGKNKTFNKKTIYYIRKYLVKAFNQMFAEDGTSKKRHYGHATMKYIKQIILNDTDARFMPYDSDSGGNGAAMRAGPFGMAFFGENNRKILIKSSIEQSKITHNCAYGYLGGLTIALFSAFAIENMELTLWPTNLIIILESKFVQKLITKDSQDQKDYLMFINYWKQYIDTRFENGKLLKLRSHRNLIFRSRYYYENFTKGTRAPSIGDSGMSASIMAFDALIDSDGKWEKLVIYAGLHLGDSDTVCAIAGFLFGLVYGMADVPYSNLKYLEYFNELIKVGYDMFKKYA